MLMSVWISKAIGAEPQRVVLASAMGKEYRIKCKALPGKRELDAMFRKLPSPIHRSRLAEIYNYRIETDGFYFVDHLTETTTASAAFRIFIDAALAANKSVEVSES